MKTKVYLGDWFYNAGIVGFLNILENANDKFAKIQDNYIEFEDKDLKNFSKYYFKYFMDKYNIANKMKDRIEKSFSRIKINILQKESNKEIQKKIQEKIKTEKKYIKQSIKGQLDKIKKYDEETYEIMYAEYLKIDSIKSEENLQLLDEIYNVLITNLYKEEINKKLTMNLFKSILSKNYFGQPSFLNVAKNASSFEEQIEHMYKDYISNIIETEFIKDIMHDKYTVEEVNSYIENLNEKLITQDIEKIYRNIKKKKNLEEIKEYLNKLGIVSCHMCENESVITEDYTEGNFIPLAISSDNMKNFFWNQNARFPICNICKLILFCIPAGISPISKIVQEIDKTGKKVYKEKEVLSFINYDTSIDNLYNTNKTFSNMSKDIKNKQSPYQTIILNIVESNKKISKWQLENIFVVEFETEYLGYSRMEYFNIKRYVAEFLINHSKSSINSIQDYKYKLEIIDYILKNKDIKYIINNRLQQCLVDNKENGYNSYLSVKARLDLNLLKKEENRMKIDIDKNNDKIYVLYCIGIDIHEELKKTKEENKLNGYTYKMLNSINAGNKKEFMDIVIRLHIFMQKDISPIFLEVMQESDLDFESIGQSFLAGLVSNKYEKKDKGEVENG